MPNNWPAEGPRRFLTFAFHFANAERQNGICRACGALDAKRSETGRTAMGGRAEDRI
jgi:hypothetical protein